jgi:hypothetical protein
MGNRQSSKECPGHTISLDSFCSSSSQDYYIQQERKLRQAADSGLRDNSKTSEVYRGHRICWKETSNDSNDRKGIISEQVSKCSE